MMTPTVLRRMRWLARPLTAEDLRGLAIACEMPEAASRQPPGLVDALIADYHEALFDRLELRINDLAKEIGS